MKKIPKKIQEEANEENETPESEMGEHEQGASEKETGIPPHGESDDDSSGMSDADIPEEFQADCQKLLADCGSLPCLDYISSKLSDKRAELMKTEQEGPPKEFSEVGMPS